MEGKGRMRGGKEEEGRGGGEGENGGNGERKGRRQQICGEGREGEGEGM